MKRFPGAAALAAGLILTLTGTAQAPGQPFRYIGAADGFVMLAADEGGARNARMLTVAAALVGERGPQDSDSFVFGIKSDCDARTVQLVNAKAYSGDEELPVSGGTPPPRGVDPDSGFELAFNYACSGKVPDGAPIWIEGVDAARAYAIKRASGEMESQK